MAWRARVADNIIATQDGLLLISVQYYDDADPANSNVSPTVPPTVVLWFKAWTLPIGTSTAQLQAAVIQEGQKARSWKTFETAARASVPLGTTVAIP